jgi:DNA-binding Xre family transcriptional regulator
MRKVRLKVKEVSEAKGISMYKLHMRSELALSTVKRLFKDPYSEVTVGTLARLGDVLGVSTSELIEDEESPDHQ